MTIEIDFDKLFDACCKHLKTSKDSININLHFVDKDEISDLNSTHRGKAEPTDVLSFPLLDLKSDKVPTVDTFPNDINPETGKLELGDIVICKEMAGLNLSDKTHSTLNDKIAFLYVHGVLHLFGYAHATKRDFKTMMSHTQTILNDYNKG